MSGSILVGDCRDVLPTLPDASVHCCVTSPPYWGLRSYMPGVVAIRRDIPLEKQAEIIAEIERLGIFPVAIISD